MAADPDRVTYGLKPVAAAAVLSESKAFAAAAQLGSVWQRAERLSQVRARGSASRACASPPPELGGL